MIKRFLAVLFNVVIMPKGEGEKVDVETAFNGGLADLDVCWNSRADPCSEKTKYDPTHHSLLCQVMITS